MCTRASHWSGLPTSAKQSTSESSTTCGYVAPDVPARIVVVCRTDAFDGTVLLLRTVLSGRFTTPMTCAWPAVNIAESPTPIPTATRPLVISCRLAHVDVTADPGFGAAELLGDPDQEGTDDFQADGIGDKRCCEQ